MPLPRLSALPPRPGAYVGPGSMNQWIQILAPGGRNMTDGGPQPPSPVYTGWADVRTLSGPELVKAQQIVQQVTHQVVIPYATVPSSAQAEKIPIGGLIQYDGRTLVIESIADSDERKFQLTILAVERNQNV